MGVRFDKSGRQHMVGEPVVDDVFTPTGALIDRTDRKNSTAGHRNRCCVGATVAHRDDSAGWIDGVAVHRSSFAPIASPDAMQHAEHQGLLTSLGRGFAGR